jgi:DNA-binding LacI/PurR family transcriptional regulator
MLTNDVPVNDEFLLSRTSRITLQEQLIRLIIKKIAGKKYLPGDKLPSVRELADQFSVSRETAKLALGNLRDRGYVEILPGRGAYVLDSEHSPDKLIRTGTLGFVVDIGERISESYDYHMVYDNLLRYVDRQVTGSGFHLMTSYIGLSDPSGFKGLKSLAEKVDGLILAGLHSREIYYQLGELCIPVVSVLSNLDLDGVDDIGIDNRKTYRNAARFLLECGCRNLLYVDGPENYYQQEQRYSGCREALKDSGFEDVNLEQMLSRDWLPEDSCHSFLDYLASGHKVDGILCVNDLIAVGIVQACQQADLRIPEDVKIIGGKNTLLSHSTVPPLSSIDCHYDGISAIAVKRMMDHLSGTVKTAAKIELLGTLIHRGSAPQDKKE